MEPSSPSEHRPNKQVDYFLIAIVMAALALAVYLVQRPAQAPWIRSRQVASLAPGAIVRPITATDLAGDRKIIDYRNYDKPTVIYVFSPSCVWCARNTKNINALASRKAEAFHFISLSLSEVGLMDYLNSHHLDFAIYKDIASESLQMLGLGATPQTIVVSRDGRILKNWIGAFGPESQPEIEEFFGIQLPGLDLRQQL